MLALTKTLMNSGLQLWQTVVENAFGGFTLDVTTLTIGGIVKGGTPFSYNEATRKAQILKTAKLTVAAGASDLTYTVEKNHNLLVGDNIGQVVGGKAYPITAINTSNALFDVLTVGTTLAVVLVIGDSLFQSSATGPTAAALNVIPKGLIYDDTNIVAGADLAIVIRGTVYNRRVAVPTACKASMPLIVFSDSY